MALDPSKLAQDLIEAQNRARNTATPEEANIVWAEAVARAINTFVKSGDVTTTGNQNTQTGKIN